MKLDPTPVALSWPPPPLWPALDHPLPTHANVRSNPMAPSAGWCPDGINSVTSPTRASTKCWETQSPTRIVGFDSIEKKYDERLKNGSYPVFSGIVHNAYIYQSGFFPKKDVKSAPSSISNRIRILTPNVAKTSPNLAFFGLELDLHSAIHGFWEDDTNICVGASSPIISNLHQVKEQMQMTQKNKKIDTVPNLPKDFFRSLKLLISKLNQNTTF